MLAAKIPASNYIGSVDVAVTIQDTDEDIKVTRALKAIATGDEYLISE